MIEKTNRRRLSAVLALAGLLFLFVVVKAEMIEQATESTYLVLAIVFLLLGLAVWRREDGPHLPRR